MPPILVVDDNPAVLDAMYDLLELHGYETYTTLDGEEAVQRVQEIQPAVVLLDLDLHTTPGVEVARRIRTLDVRQPAIIAISGKPEEHPDLNIVAAVEKGTSPDRLITLVVEAVCQVADNSYTMDKEATR